MPDGAPLFPGMVQCSVCENELAKPPDVVVMVNVVDPVNAFVVDPALETATELPFPSDTIPIHVRPWVVLPSVTRAVHRAFPIA